MFEDKAPALLSSQSYFIICFPRCERFPCAGFLKWPCVSLQQVGSPGPSARLTKMNCSLIQTSKRNKKGVLPITRYTQTFSTHH
ncbi:hypothetical protein BUE80_DR005880 [Diplocarpon rosae]|nr:hypothetical protein BUE80_DR005880 [Diplocarpon rosae]